MSLRNSDFIKWQDESDLECREQSIILFSDLETVGVCVCVFVVVVLTLKDRKHHCCGIHITLCTRG